MVYFMIVAIKFRGEKKGIQTIMFAKSNFHAFLKNSLDLKGVCICKVVEKYTAEKLK